MRKILYICSILALSLPNNTLSAQNLKTPQSIIVDTDMGLDYDDVGALAMVHNIAREKHIPILGVMCSTASDASNNAAAIVNQYFGDTKLQIGTATADAPKDLSIQEWQQVAYAKHSVKIKDKVQLTDAVALYYKLLSDAKDGSITIISIGYSSNLLKLLETPADAKKGLPSGKELIAKKVSALFTMGGAFPDGRESHFMKQPNVTLSVYQSWPGTVVFAGKELGDKIRTGKTLSAQAKSKPSPVRDVYSQCMAYSPVDKDGHESWDQMAVLAAMMPELNYFSFTPGKVLLNEDGSNSWFGGGKGQYALAFNPKIDEKAIANTIETWMNKDPK